MFTNYLKTALRNLWKNKGFAAINIVGLAIGMAACIVIMLFVFYEKSFDKQHTKNIYRLNEVQNFEGMVAPQNVALSMFPMGPTLKAEFPEIKNFTRINQFEKVPLTWNEKKVYFPQMFWADSTFLQIFDFKLLKGDRRTVLEKPNSVVLTAESATKLFGKDEPIGKTVMFYGRDTLSFMVTGVLANIPKNSHLQFDGLFSFNTLPTARMMENWGGNWVITYLELDKNADIAAMEKKFPDYLKRHMSEDNWKYYTLFLQALPDIHSGSVNITHDYLNYQKFDSNYTYIFSIIALIVLVIACINFMNLSTARSTGRAREVGVRKSIGARRLQLSFQFVMESVILSLIALLLAILLVQLLLPYVSDLSQRSIRFPLFSDASLPLIIIAGTIVVGALSGLYPAAYLSSFQPVKVLKGSPQSGKNKSLFRNVLVVGQFTAAIFLMIATVFALRQLRFMQDKDPGFTREQVMIIPIGSRANARYDALKQQLLSNNLVTGVTASGQRLGNNLHQAGVRFYGDGPMRELTSSQVIVDPDFLKLYDIPLVAGRNFREGENGKTYIINETLAKELLKDNPKAPLQSLIGKRFGFPWGDSSATIVGVAKDFNFNSMHHKIETLCLYNQKDWGFDELSVRISGTKPQDAIAHVEQTWKSMFADIPFEYVFLDEHFNTLYQADMQVSEIVGSLATLAIIISCLGLFGLASYSAERRIKEIGIRKVLGATVQNLVSLLSRDFVKLVLLANLIAWPIAWYALDRWLSDFAYRVNIQWWVFAAAGLAALLIALCTISFQAIKAALMNPVKSLRTE
ncbi:MAG TPA: ABC transporter permease [Chitinophagaceae bacterium]|nr:ABC transporter permease [Chitinophagaceae bacterium]